jgi:hypothetical protein
MKIEFMEPCRVHFDCTMILVDIGHWCHVDTEDVSRILASFSSICLARRRGGRVYAQLRGPNGRRCYIHRFILEFPDGLVDHKFHNGLDNRKSQLRVTTNSKNVHNRRGAALGSRSGILGVHRDNRPKNRRHPWVSQITISGKKRCLGCFATPEEAKAVYDKAKEAVFV